MNANYKPTNNPIGLTKREYFAGLVMQGICASNGWDQSMDGIVKASIEMADKLLAELDKPTKTKES